MIYVYVRHRVEDYEKFREVFDREEDWRKGRGEQDFQLFRSVDDPNEITGIFGWADIGTAKEFMNAEELKEKMMAAGVIELPEIRFLNSTE